MTEHIDKVANILRVKTRPRQQIAAAIWSGPLRFSLLRSNDSTVRPGRSDR